MNLQGQGRQSMNLYKAKAWTRKIKDKAKAWNHMLGQGPKAKTWTCKVKDKVLKNFKAKANIISRCLQIFSANIRSSVSSEKEKENWETARKYSRKWLTPT